MHRPHVSCSVLVLALALGCAKAEPPPPPAPPGPPAAVRVVAADFSFEMPDTLTAGLTTFTLANSGAELHHLQIIRLEQGKNISDLSEWQPPAPPPSWMVLMGGPNAAAPGPGEIQGTVDLVPGNYVALCFIPSGANEMKGHYKMGMVRPFTVVAASDKRVAPEAHFTITLNDYSFTFSAPVPAGEHAIKVVNSGPQDHEVVIIKLDPGKKAGDVLAWFGAGMKGPPPGQPVGGTTGLSPNGENIIHVTLVPGDYGLYCFVDDAKDGKMHIEHGMVSQFTVQ